MVSQAEEGEVGERLEVGGERGTVRLFFLIGWSDTDIPPHRCVGLVRLMELREIGWEWSGTARDEENTMAPTRARLTSNL